MTRAMSLISKDIRRRRGGQWMSCTQWFGRSGLMAGQVGARRTCAQSNTLGQRLTRVIRRLLAMTETGLNAMAADAILLRPRRHRKAQARSADDGDEEMGILCLARAAVDDHRHLVASIVDEQFVAAQVRLPLGRFVTLPPSSRERTFRRHILGTSLAMRGSACWRNGL